MVVQWHLRLEYFIQLNNQNTSIKLEECTSMYLREGSPCKKKVIYTDLHISVDYIRSSLNEAIRYLDSIDFDQYRPDSQFILQVSYSMCSLFS